MIFIPVLFCFLTLVPMSILAEDEHYELFEVYEVSIDGETYLFNRTGVRFCRIPPGVQYSCSLRQEGRERIMTVSFDDPTLEPHIFSWRKYELVSASRETVPWLFDKAKEGPRGMDDAGGSTSADRVDDGERSVAVQGSQSAPAQVENQLYTASESTTHPPFWIWIIGGCVLAGAIALMLLPARKNR